MPITDMGVDPATWRLLRLKAEQRWADGMLDTVEIEALLPPEWIAEHRAVVASKRGTSRSRWRRNVGGAKGERCEKRATAE